MAWAQAATQEHWHRFAHLVGGGDLLSNENATTRTSQLDIESGIDWFVRQTRNGIPGNIPMAGRVQDSTKASWASFTIREKRHGGSGVTELQRRKAERETPGSVTPHYVCQVYVDKNQNWTPLETTGRFTLAAVVKELDLLAAEDAGLFTRRLNDQEQNRSVDFIAFWWNVLRDSGYEVAHVCGDGVSLIDNRRKVSPFVQRRTPCVGCGYYYAVNGDHRTDCTAIFVSELEAQAAVATVFEVS
jgi:hypothetical protein